MHSYCLLRNNGTGNCFVFQFQARDNRGNIEVFPQRVLILYILYVIIPIVPIMIFLVAAESWRRPYLADFLFPYYRRDSVITRGCRGTE